MSDIQTSTQCQLLSVVVPLYNEQDSIIHLYNQLTSALQNLPCRYEILFVDDGSRDNTWQEGAKLAEQDSSLRLIRFRKNYGQTPAMAAGIDAARGDIICTMDGDLQNDPADIPMMLEKMEQGFDLVVGWRFMRQDKWLSRKLPSMIANRLIAKATGVPIHDNGCSLKLYRSKLMKAIPFYSEMHRFIPALLSLSGAKVAEVKVRHHARQFGDSKYGLSRTYKVLLDLLVIKTILSLKMHPVRWFGKIALLPLLAAMLSFIGMMAEVSRGGSSIVMATVGILCFSLSLFLISLGFICELSYSRSNFKLKELLSLTAIRPVTPNPNTTTQHAQTRNQFIATPAITKERL